MPLGMLGKYERLDVLGHGASGIVYLAKDTLLNKQVALKEVDVQTGDVRRFLEEARVMDRLRHPHIVRVNSVDRIDDKILIDMEYVRGQNLQEILRREGSLPVERALEVAAETLDALDYAHSMQTVHRDVKPANILIGSSGEVKLADFGLAEILATNAYAGGAGTYAYMAPEDFAEEDRSDHQSDIWAVGVTLFEMLTGQRPFQVAKVKDPFSWKRALENQMPRALASFLPNAPTELQAVLDRALSQDKRLRYPTAGAFRDDLRRLRAGQSVEAETLRVGRLAAARRASLPAFPSPEYDISAPALPHSTGGYLDLPEKEDETDGTVGTVPAVGVKPRKVTAKTPARAKLRVNPSGVDFGALHQGEIRSVRLMARTTGGTGRVNGRVLCSPDWLSVHPTAFDSVRQVITLTAHTERVRQIGEFFEAIRVETEDGQIEIPVHLLVQAPRPTFRQVAAWYVPLFLMTLLPAMAVAFGGIGSQMVGMGELVPSAVVASGLLSMMLLIICFAADTGIAERLACGILMLTMCLVLGLSVAAIPHNRSMLQTLQPAFLVGGVVGAVLLLQMLHPLRWKLWGFALFGLGLLISSAFLHQLHVI